jgi:UDP-glucose 4-epimerase
MKYSSFQLIILEVPLTRAKFWLITGSQGYLGRHLTSRFSDLKIPYIGIDKATSPIGSSSPRAHEIQGSYTDEFLIEKIFTEYEIEGVIHLAALKDVSDSLKNPKLYMDLNFHESKTFLENCLDLGLSKFIFASSAAVYGNQNTNLGFTEDSPIQVSNPYGESKIEFERFLSYKSQESNFSSVILRFFNLGGSVLGISSDHQGSNLVPKILKAVIAKQEVLVYGNEYPTKDGSAERDYIHIMDVVDAVIKSTKYLGDLKGCEIFNIGSGRAVSVLEVIKMFSEKLDLDISYRVVEGRSGDSFRSFANIDKAASKLEWLPRLGFYDLVTSYEETIKTNIS